MKVCVVYTMQLLHDGMVGLVAESSCTDHITLQQPSQIPASVPNGHIPRDAKGLSNGKGGLQSPADKCTEEEKEVISDQQIEVQYINFNGYVIAIDMPSLHGLTFHFE